MSDIPTCLSVFAVAAWANKPEALSHAEKAIDSYLGAFAPDEARDALVALRQAYAEMHLNSRVGLAIRETIETRLA